MVVSIQPMRDDGRVPLGGIGRDLDEPLMVEAIELPHRGCTSMRYEAITSPQFGRLQPGMPGVRCSAHSEGVGKAGHELAVCDSGSDGMRTQTFCGQLFAMDDALLALG